MLASIHPLGERARRSRWWVTVVAYAVGSVAGGVAVGALGGAVGFLVLRTLLGWSSGPALPPALVAVVATAAAIGDLGGLHLRIPSWHRQVNEDWLQRYRGWVYGIGFGFQLGLGVVTIVTTAAVYAVVVLAVVGRSATVGAAVGSVFGLARALPVLAAARVEQPGQLRRLHARLDRASVPARRAASSTLALAAAAAAAAGWAAR